MSSQKSALFDNIESKGKNAYYFAHAKTAKGPKWDNKAEPRLLAKLVVNSAGSETASAEGSQQASTTGEITDSIHKTDVEHELDLNDTLKMLQSHKNSRKRLVAYDSFKSNITKYAFMNEEKKVKLYIDLPGVHMDGVEIDLNYDEVSFCLTVRGLKDSNGSSVDGPVQPRCLSFGKLYGSITKATYKVKSDRIIIILTKEATMVSDDNAETKEGEDNSNKTASYKEWPSISARLEDEF